MNKHSDLIERLEAEAKIWPRSDISGLLKEAATALRAADLQLERAVERCESGDPECGPVEFHDVEGVPLCKGCWEELAVDSADGARPPAGKEEKSK